LLKIKLLKAYSC